MFQDYLDCKLYQLLSVVKMKHHKSEEGIMWKFHIQYPSLLCHYLNLTS